MQGKFRLLSVIDARFACSRPVDGLIGVSLPLVQPVVNTIRMNRIKALNKVPTVASG